MNRNRIVTVTTGFFTGTLNQSRLERELNAAGSSGLKLTQAIREEVRILFLFRREAHFLVFVPLSATEGTPPLALPFSQTASRPQAMLEYEVQATADMLRQDLSEARETLGIAAKHTARWIGPALGICAGILVVLSIGVAWLTGWIGGHTKPATSGKRDVAPSYATIRRSTDQPSATPTPALSAPPFRVRAAQPRSPEQPTPQLSAGAASLPPGSAADSTWVPPEITARSPGVAALLSLLSTRLSPDGQHTVIDTTAPPLVEIDTFHRVRLLLPEGAQKSPVVEFGPIAADVARVAAMAETRRAEKIAVSHDGNVLLVAPAEELAGETLRFVAGNNFGDTAVRKLVAALDARAARTPSAEALQMPPRRSPLLTFYPIVPSSVQAGAALVEMGGEPLLEIDDFKAAALIANRSDPGFRGIDVVLEDADARRLHEVAIRYEGRIAAAHDGDVVRLAGFDGDYSHVRLDSHEPRFQSAIRKVIARLETRVTRVAPPPAATAPTPSDEQIREFLLRHLAADRGRSIERVLATYSEQVDYFNNGVVDHAFIRNDKEAYFRRWPQGSESVVGPIEVHSSGDHWEVKYTATFRVESAERGEWIEGRTESNLQIGRADDSLFITAQKVKVSDQKKGALGRSAAIPSSTPKPNPHGVPDGSYYHTSSETGPHGSANSMNNFVVRGSTFDWYRTSTYTPNAAGRAARKVATKTTYHQRGAISRNPDGTVGFRPLSANLVSKLPANRPDSETDIDELRRALKRPGYTLTYSAGSLIEPSSGNRWTRRD